MNAVVRQNAARLATLALCAAAVAVPWGGSAFYTELAA